MSHAGVVASRTLADEYSSIVRDLAPSEWSAPSRCVGWTVKDLVAHTGSNFAAIVNPTEPDPSVPPPKTAEELQNRLVDARRDWTPTQVADEFLSTVGPAMDVLTAMQDPAVASAPMTLTDLGTYETHQLSDAFAFDMWCHMYVDLLAPEGPVSRRLDGGHEALLDAAIGWMLAGLPQMCRPVNAALDGRAIGLRLKGPGGGEWSLQPGPDLLSVNPGIDRSDTVITSSAADFVVWGTTRSPWREHVTIDGDDSHAGQVLDTLDIV
ncbi:maleylpyruvate isomerase family mycothiol-dependent enzyme [Gordonia sp. NPDC058843]|uniref:maleylpyruvate isomerase family mycothiol-dependent enzyme n=1 Tax=Gordonia sp. NPDC058843 TaxID=3346648 RepID=UPI0036C5BC62